MWVFFNRFLYLRFFKEGSKQQEKFQQGYKNRLERTHLNFRSTILQNEIFLVFRLPRTSGIILTQKTANLGILS